MKKFLSILLIVMILGAIAGAFLFYMRSREASGPTSSNTTGTGNNVFNPFNPIDRGNNGNNSSVGSTSNNLPTSGGTSTITTNKPAEKIPALRQLSSTPVGGMGATTTATTSLVRFIDRGTGHVFETSDATIDVRTVSNTTLPRVYESYWNKNASALILRYLKEDSDVITTFYGELLAKPVVKSATSSNDSITSTPFELKGKFLSPNITNIAVAPKRDKIFEYVNENEKGTGYISSFDERSRVAVFDSPMTQVNIEWPEENTIAFTTKGSSYGPGYLYFLNPKTGDFKKIIGGLRGLSTLTSKDATKVLYDVNSGQQIQSFIYNTKDKTNQQLVFRTFPEKCVWATLHKEDLYCGVPAEIPASDYPDAWYQGRVSTVDQIWHLDTTTGEVHLIANLLQISGKIFDIQNLALDPKENFLYFTNKKDLSLWSLDIGQ